MDFNIYITSLQFSTIHYLIDKENILKYDYPIINRNTYIKIMNGFNILYEFIGLSQTKIKESCVQAFIFYFSLYSPLFFVSPTTHYYSLSETHLPPPKRQRRPRVAFSVYRVAADSRQRSLVPGERLENGDVSLCFVTRCIRARLNHAYLASCALSAFFPFLLVSPTPISIGILVVLFYTVPLFPFHRSSRFAAQFS